MTDTLARLRDLAARLSDRKGWARLPKDWSRPARPV